MQVLQEGFSCKLLSCRITSFQEGARELRKNKPPGTVCKSAFPMNKNNFCFSHINLIFQVSIDGNDSVSSTGMIGENEQEKKMQVCSTMQNKCVHVCSVFSVHSLTV